MLFDPVLYFICTIFAVVEEVPSRPFLIDDLHSMPENQLSLPHGKAQPGKTGCLCLMFFRR